MPTIPLRTPFATKLPAKDNPRAPPRSTETQYDDLDCCDLLRASRDQCRQGCVVLNLGLHAVANEVFSAGSVELVFRKWRSIPVRFGGLDRDHAPELQRTRKDGIAAAAYQLASGARRSIVSPTGRADMPAQECRGFSGVSWSFSAIRPSSGRERAFILCIALLRWTFTVASAKPISLAICLLRRPRAT